MEFRLFCIGFYVRTVVYVDDPAVANAFLGVEELWFQNCRSDSAYPPWRNFHTPNKIMAVSNSPKKNIPAASPEWLPPELLFEEELPLVFPHFKGQASKALITKVYVHGGSSVTDRMYAANYQAFSR